ncbi:hypothetical protein I862_03240 [endosymbiont of Acanthamoeba sp. UWC8]|uniref:hypothetical protein n=1 Tax=endosymbiont of Acanthamoeba sp. UWC8 TaxID=86106 RepID=UPI0004D0D0C2|nr:hypothetical protein [endosymbiont of Acanthamoeba sp. UWC8]AIF81208.1 hypothetical protein I862_03240 [endosymbiont of Acanthamoeba sp. UWC8]
MRALIQSPESIINKEIEKACYDSMRLVLEENYELKNDYDKVAKIEQGIKKIFVPVVASSTLNRLRVEEIPETVIARVISTEDETGHGKGSLKKALEKNILAQLEKHSAPENSEEQKEAVKSFDDFYKDLAKDYNAKCNQRRLLVKECISQSSPKIGNFGCLLIYSIIGATLGSAFTYWDEYKSQEAYSTAIYGAVALGVTSLCTIAWNTFFPSKSKEQLLTEESILNMNEVKSKYFQCVNEFVGVYKHECSLLKGEGEGKKVKEITEEVCSEKMNKWKDRLEGLKKAVQGNEGHVSSSRG